MIKRALRVVAVAALALAVTVAPASAEFSVGDVTGLLSSLGERGDLSSTQQKALTKAQALADKSYKDAAAEVIAYSKLAKLLGKAFPGDEEVGSSLQAFCNEEGGINSIAFQMVYGDNGIGEAAVVGASAGIKGATLFAKKVAIPFNKANESSDCAKKLKGWAKALKGAALVIKKYGAK